MYFQFYSSSQTQTYWDHLVLFLVGSRGGTLISHKTKHRDIRPLTHSFTIPIARIKEEYCSPSFPYALVWSNGNMGCIWSLYGIKARMLSSSKCQHYWFVYTRTYVTTPFLLTECWQRSAQFDYYRNRMPPKAEGKPAKKPEVYQSLTFRYPTN